MKDTITEFFFVELAVFFAVKQGIDNPKSCISFFRMCRKFLVEIEGFLAYDGYKYPASTMINFLLLCAFMSLQNAVKRVRIPLTAQRRGYGIGI